MKKQIFKIQTPLAGPPTALIYNKDRSASGMIPITPEIEKLMKGEPKKFVYAIHREDGQIEILEEAKWQTW